MEKIKSNEIKIEPYKLYNKDKYIDFINDKKYQDIRNKILDAFKDLEFEEGPHKYYINGKEITCVSNVTHMYQEHFDADAVAQKTFERNYNNPDNKYYQMTPDEIKKQWKNISGFACAHGTERHEWGESCFYFMCGWYDRILPEFKNRLHQDENGDYYFEAKFAKEVAVAKFWTDLPKCVVPILAETKVYDKNRGYSGTFDILFYLDNSLNDKPLKTNGLWIFDYKSNRDLYKNFNNKKLLFPFDGLLDMPLSIYKLQLSLYQNPLENLGFNVVARTIIWMKPDGEYEKIKLESYVDKLRKDLSERVKRDGRLIID